MNIFVLDEDPCECARFHNDRHVAKMILDCAQILSAAHIMLDGRETAKSRVALVERPEHISDPSAVWARATCGNYRWTALLMDSLIQQFKLRSGGRGHQYERMSQEYARREPLNIKIEALTPFVYCGPVQFRHSSVVESYRRYYYERKQDMAVWTVVGAPKWWKQMRGDKEVRRAS